LQLTQTGLKRALTQLIAGLSVAAAIGARAQVDVLTQHNDNARTEATREKLR
jgi:hypothetical protein